MNQLLDHIKAYPGIDNGTKLWEWKLKLDELAEQAATGPSGMKAVVDAVMFWNSCYWPTGSGKRDALRQTLMKHCIGNDQYRESMRFHESCFNQNYAKLEADNAEQMRMRKENGAAADHFEKLYLEADATIKRQQQELDAYDKAVAPFAAWHATWSGPSVLGDLIAAFNRRVG